MSDDSSVRTSAQSALTPAASDITDPMQQNARPCINKKNDPDPSLPKPLSNPELTQRQLAALGLLLQGLSDSSVADKAWTAPPLRLPAELRRPPTPIEARTAPATLLPGF